MERERCKLTCVDEHPFSRIARKDDLKRGKRQLMKEVPDLINILSRRYGKKKSH